MFLFCALLRLFFLVWYISKFQLSFFIDKVDVKWLEFVNELIIFVVTKNKNEIETRYLSLNLNLFNPRCTDN